ncbi:hypothetical protein A5646_03290 [Mycobacterium sp. 1245499.0]|nr:hypothetical protein A5646_03290 [Mycobacterium sp. 1245499.0]
MWVWAASALLTFAVYFSIPAHADPGSIEPQVMRYALASAPAMCAVLDKYPTLPGVEGVLQGIQNDSGFTPYQAGEALAVGVQVQCPRHVALLQRFADTYAPRTSGVGATV